MLCEHRCGIDRLAGESAPCGLGTQTFCFKRHVSFAEEIELLPSYMVYFSGCNFRCRFCVQGPTCFSPMAGEVVEAADLVAECLQKIKRGAKTINLLGGEPSIHLHTILEMSAATVEPLPMVLNSNMYMTPEVMELLDGVIAIYLADFKFGNDECARQIARVSRYIEVVTRNLKIAHSQAEVMIRHLLMPGHFDCCFVPVAEWVAHHMPQVRFNLMTSYVPAWQAAADHGSLGRCPTESEVRAAQKYALQLGLRGSD